MKVFIMRLLYLIAIQAAAVSSWPDGGNLLGFWPFDNTKQFKDAAYNRGPGSGNQLSISSMPGPFGVPYTSVVSTGGSAGVEIYSTEDGLQSYTVSFFYYTTTSSKGGSLSTILTMEYTFAQWVCISITQNNLLHIHSHLDTEDINVGIQTNAWNFIAITYSGCGGTVYNANGFVTNFGVGCTSLSCWSWDECQLQFGYNDGRLIAGDGVACLMVYKNDLSAVDVAKLPHECYLRNIPTCTPTCQNGGSCVSYNKCSCTAGWTGTECTIPTCSSPCQNGGTCTAPNTCTCTGSWSGTTCIIPVCSPSCQHGGTCVAPNVCSCTINWNGTVCEIPICAPSCQNGGTCTAPNTCSCTGSWTGATCTIPVCSPTCQHGGTCVAPNVCACTLSWNGTICEIPVCAPSCQNGGTCTAPNVCSCTASWTGGLCTIPVCSPTCQYGGTCIAPDTCSCIPSWNGTICDIPVCSPSCKNGATCTSPNVCACTAAWSGGLCTIPICNPTCQNGGYCSNPGQCQCTLGWSGGICTIPVCNPDCLNGGTCSAPHTCSCTSSWNGTICETPVCSSPCQHGGTCTAPNTCSCAAGWTGSNCATPICTSPCLNGGTCSDPNTCTCATGWTGSTCASPICNPSCQNGGTCSGPYTCTCPTGWNGSACTSPICTSPCQNSGTCTAPNTCACTASWNGSTCGIPVCSSPCLNGGTCSAPNTCSCATGWNGTTCGNPICNSGCLNGGTCSSPNHCTCATGWTGVSCATPICVNPCQHGGTCTGPNTCSCATGWNGTACEKPICASACQNGGTCSAPNTCTCAAGWTGATCGTPICNPACQNGGTCIGPNTCSCTAIWAGPICTHPSCTPACQHGGTCIALNTCSCVTGWNGTVCNNPICSSPCQHGGTCSAPDSCTCPADWTGSFCVSPACNPACLNGGTCIAPNVCSCPTGWTGSNCGSAICTDPCLHGGTCSAPNVCSCTTQWNGTTCQYPICDSPACASTGTCTAPNVCTCSAGWTSNSCGQPICSPPCLNGGTCASPQVCTCPSGYTGANCQTPICYCQNGGTCIAPDTCLCTTGYTGKNCTIPICYPACQNGGTCVGPNKCECAVDWQGVVCNITTVLPPQPNPVSINYLGNVDDNVLVKFQEQLKEVVNMTSEAIVSNPKSEAVAESAVNFMESLSSIVQRYDTISDSMPLENLQNLSLILVESADAVMAAATNGTLSDDIGMPDYYPDLKACPNKTETEEYGTTAAPQPVQLDSQKQTQLFNGFNGFITSTINIAKKSLKPGDTFRFNGSFFAVSVMSVALENIPGLQVSTQFAILRFPFVIPPDEHFADFDPTLDPSTTYITLTIISYIQNVADAAVPTNMAAVSLSAEFNGKSIALNKENPITIILLPLVKKQQRFSAQKVYAQCDVSKMTCDLTTNADTIGSLASLPIMTGSGDFMLLFPVIPLNYTAYIALNAVPTEKFYNWSVTVTEKDYTLKSNTKLPDLELNLKKGKEFRAKIKAASIVTALGPDVQRGRVYVYMKKDLSKYGALDDLPPEACDLQHCFAYHLQVQKTGGSTGSTRRKRQSADDEDTLELSPSSNEAAAQFTSNYFGDYGANLAIPPNTIEFSDIFSNFTSLLEDNYAVLTAQVGGIAIFLVGIVIAVIFDNRDLKEWAFLPIVSNQPDQTNTYLISVNHYAVRHHGKSPKVSIRLLGEEKDTPWRLLEDNQKRKNFEGKLPANFKLTTYYPIGLLEAIELLVENPLPTPEKKKPMQIFIDKVIVVDVESHRKYLFPLRTNMVPDMVERVPLAAEDEIKGFRYLVNSHCRVGFTDSHPWLSIARRPLPSSWTRAERVGCVVSALYMAMLVNAMFYGKEANAPRVGVKVGNFFRISWFTLWTSLVGSAIIVPPTTIIAFIFNKIRRRSAEKSQLMNVFNVKVNKYDLKDETKIKKEFVLPFFCVIFAWALVAICIGVSAFFVFMYSLSWGREKSLQWLSGIVMHIVQDIIIIQTVKVVIFSVAKSTVLNLPDDGVNIGKMTFAKSAPVQQKNTELFVRLRNMTAGVIHHIFYVIAFVLIIAMIRSPYSYWQVRDLKPLVTMDGNQQASDPINDYDVIFYWLRNKLVPTFTNGNQIFYGGVYKESNMYKVQNHDAALIGPIRVRQQRVSTAPCPLQSALYGARFAVGLADSGTTVCQKKYIDEVGVGDSSETRSFALSWSESAVVNFTTANNETAWIYRTTDGPPYIGKEASYKTGGYYIDLPPRMAKAQAILAELQSLRWLDNATSVIFVDFILYNANVNLFIAVKIVFEALSSGGMNYHANLYPLSLYQYTGADSMATFVIQGIWVIVLITHIVKIARQIKKDGWKKFRQDGWNLFKMCEIMLAVSIVGLSVARIIVIINTITEMRTNHTSYTNLDLLVNWDDVMYNLYGIAFFMTMLLFFRHLTMNKYWAVFLGTLSKGKGDIIGFVVILALITAMFAGIGHMVMGSFCSEFQSFGASVMTLVQNIIGVTGSMMRLSFSSRFMMAFCAAYSTVVMFLAVQIFIAIISRTYSFVVDDVEGNTIWDADLSDYMSDEWQRLFSKSDNKENDEDNESPSPQEETDATFDNLECALDRIVQYADKSLDDQSKRDRKTFPKKAINIRDNVDDEIGMYNLEHRRSQIEREVSAKSVTTRQAGYSSYIYNGPTGADYLTPVAFEESIEYD